MWDYYDIKKEKKPMPPTMRGNRGDTGGSDRNELRELMNNRGKKEHATMFAREVIRETHAILKKFADKKGYKIKVGGVSGKIYMDLTEALEEMFMDNIKED